MPDYLVEWDIDIFDVPTPHGAAEEALRIHRNPQSIATVFSVTNTETGVRTVVDLSKNHELGTWETIDAGNRGFINDTGEVDNR